MPARLRGDVLALSPIIVASWALGGLYLSLGPSVAAGVFGIENHLIGTLAVLAAPHERGELFAVALVIAYLAFSVPAVVAGLAATSFSLHATALVYGTVVAALGVAALVAQSVAGQRMRS